MKKYVQAACAFLITFVPLQTAHSITGAREDLFNSFSEYRLNAFLIIPDCMMLTISEFDEVWERIVTLLTRADQRDFYFNGAATWQECVRECKVLSDWLSTLYVDIAAGDLIRHTKSVALPPHALSIVDYWTKKRKQDEISVDVLTQAEEYRKSRKILGFQFYAFYIDSLTHLYEEYSKCARDPYQEKVVSKAYLRLLTVCLRDLEKLLTKLKNFTTANHYTFAVKKLRDIKRLVDEQQL